MFLLVTYTNDGSVTHASLHPSWYGATIATEENEDGADWADIVMLKAPVCAHCGQREVEDPTCNTRGRVCFPCFRTIMTNFGRDWRTDTQFGS